MTIEDLRDSILGNLSLRRCDQNIEWSDGEREWVDCVLRAAVAEETQRCISVVVDHQGHTSSAIASLIQMRAPK